MGTTGGAVQPDGAPPLVAFDFDGTITCRDSFMAFLRWRAGPVRFLVGLTRLAPATAGYAVHRDRGRLKMAAAREFLGGLTETELAASASAFAAAESARLLRPDALRCWQDWKRRSARLVIVTASPEIIVAAFARALGAETTIGTRMALDAAGRITGDFHGANCRGEEKVTRLRETFGPDVRLAAAYGDTAGDREMLAIAGEAGYRVFTARP